MYTAKIFLLCERQNEKMVDETTESELKVCQEIIKKEVMAAIFLQGVDKECYDGLKNALAQNMSMGNNQYLEQLKRH